VSKERIAGIDLSAPPQPSPICGRTEPPVTASTPDVFFPTSEEEAGSRVLRVLRDPRRLAWALKNGERYGVGAGLHGAAAPPLVRFVARSPSCRAGPAVGHGRAAATILAGR
jgi:hypothetical protein